MLKEILDMEPNFLNIKSADCFVKRRLYYVR